MLKQNVIFNVPDNACLAGKAESKRFSVFVAFSLCVRLLSEPTAGGKDSLGRRTVLIRQNEFSRAHDVLNRLEDLLRRSDVPEERYEALVRSAEVKIVARKDIAEILEALAQLASLLK